MDDELLLLEQERRRNGDGKMTKDELIKNQFPNDEFLQSAVSLIVDKCVADTEEKLAKAKDYIRRLLNLELSTDEWAELAVDAALFIM